MGSVWLGEVDKALMELMKSTIRFKDEEDILQVPSITVRNPEGEFLIKTFPAISFFNYRQEFAKKRFNFEDINSGFTEDGKVIMEKPAIPYDLSYQIDFWSEYQEDMNEMTRRWLGNIPPQTTLKVEDSEGNIRHCVMNLIDYAEIEELEDNIKVFHKAYSYKIWVELDERQPEYLDAVLEVDVLTRRF